MYVTVSFGYTVPTFADGIEPGLYYPKKINISNEPELAQNKIKKNRKTHLLISGIIGILSLILVALDGNIMRAVGNGVFCFILTYIILFSLQYYIYFSLY